MNQAPSANTANQEIFFMQCLTQPQGHIYAIFVKTIKGFLDCEDYFGSYWQ